ncbi:MAG: hypothetical protein DWI22_11240 [Planctomycetota bacterium]|nr:MAG: hypothetical protein DWI22_11240 [Planctomycetota bacterium]
MDIFGKLEHDGVLILRNTVHAFSYFTIGAGVVSDCKDFNDRQGLALEDCGREGQTVNRCDTPMRRYDIAEERVSMRDDPARRKPVCGNGRTQSTLCLTMFLSNSQIR